MVRYTASPRAGLVNLQDLNINLLKVDDCHTNKIMSALVSNT